jgi:hypothetical protein
LTSRSGSFRCGFVAYAKPENRPNDISLDKRGEVSQSRRPKPMTPRPVIDIQPHRYGWVCIAPVGQRRVFVLRPQAIQFA